MSTTSPALLNSLATACTKKTKTRLTHYHVIQAYNFKHALKEHTPNFHDP